MPYVRKYNAVCITALEASSSFQSLIIDVEAK
jgi:hypothetical protein